MVVIERDAKHQSQLDFEIACTEADIERLRDSLVLKYRELHSLYIERNGSICNKQRRGQDGLSKGNMGDNDRGFAEQDHEYSGTK